VSDFHLVAWVILRDPKGRVLLARRSGVRYGSGLWGLPGGHVEGNETLAQAAARETAEEVGVTVRSSDLRPVGFTRYADAEVQGVDVFFTTHTWTGEPAAVGECDAVAFFDPAALPPDALPWLGRALDTHVLRGNWFDESVRVE